MTAQELSYWTEATQHAVVIAGMDDLQVHLYDPAFSDTPCTIPIDEFALSWLKMDEFYTLIQPS